MPTTLAAIPDALMAASGDAASTPTTTFDAYAAQAVVALSGAGVAKNDMPELVGNLLTTGSTAAPAQNPGWQWNTYDPAELYASNAMFGYGGKDLLGAAGFTGNQVVATGQREFGENGQMMDTWGVSPELLAWLEKNQYKLGWYNDGETSYNALLGPDGQPVGEITSASNHPNKWMGPLTKTLLGAMFGGAALTGIGAIGAAGGGGGAGSGLSAAASAPEYLAAADAAGGLLPEFGTSSLYDAAIAGSTAIPEAAATAADLATSSGGITPAAAVEPIAPPPTVEPGAPPGMDGAQNSFLDQARAATSPQEVLAEASKGLTMDDINTWIEKAKKAGEWLNRNPALLTLGGNMLAGAFGPQAQAIDLARERFDFDKQRFGQEQSLLDQARRNRNSPIRLTYNRRVP